MKSVKSTVERTNTREMLKILNEQVPVGVCIMQDGKLCYANSTFPLATGYTVDELIGKDSWEIVVPEDREMVNENTIKMLKGELLSPYQFRVICKDGSIVWVMATVKSIRYQGRQAILGSYMEVTERKQMEERYKLLADHSADIIYRLGLEDEHFTYASPAVERILGYTEQEALALQPQDVLTPESYEKQKNEMLKDFESGISYRTLQLEAVHKEGHIIPVEVSVHLVTDEKGQPVEVIGVVRDITERKKAEEALKESAERYRELADSITDVFFAMDEHLRYTYWNKSSEILTGIRAEYALGKSLLEVFPDTPGTKRAEKVYRKVLRTQQPQTFVNDYDIDGRHYSFEISAYPSRGGISVFVKDITERKKAEEALRKSEEKYRTMIEVMGNGYFETDHAGNFTFVNDAMIRLLGYSREEIIGLNYKAYTPEEKVNAVFEAYNRIYKTGEPLINFDSEVIRKDGSHIFAETSAFPMRNHKGEIVGFRGVRRNITERKQAEEALHQSRERYRTMLEEMEDSYFETDLAGNLTFVNSATCRNLGYSREELMGMSYKNFTAKEDLESVFQMFNEVYRTGTPNKGFPWKIIRKDGGHGFTETSVSLIRNDAGDIIGFRGVGRDITERKKMEEALNLQKAYFQQLFDNSPDAIIIVDISDRLIHANKGFEALFGYSAEELQRQSIRKLIVPEDDTQRSVSLQKVFSGEVVRIESVRRRKDGSLVNVSILSYPIRVNDKVVGACLTYTDITKRKQAEEALRRSEERYRTILEEMEDAYFETDLGGHLTFVNSSTCSRLGYSQEELMGMSYKKFTAEEDIESVFRVFNEVYRTGMPNKSFPWTIIRKDGSHRLVEHSALPLRNDKGEIIGFRGVGRDITEHKQAEEALRQSRENYRALFNSAVTGMIVIDAEALKIVMANQAAATIFGFGSAEEGIGVNPLDFFPPEDRDRVLEIIMKELIEQNSRRTFELRAVTKDGREIWISTTGARIIHEGKLAGLISFTDITEQKGQNERLMLTDRLASIGELAAGTAHELNNPLTSVIGFSQLLMEKDIPDDIREDLTIIYSEAQRAAGVIKNLLAFARKHAPTKQYNQINNIIEDVLKLRSYEHQLNGIEVEKQLAPDLPESMVDYFQMQQVFLNLVINAEYFMTAAHNRGTLTITTKNQNNTVSILIADDGPGIPAENLSRIFDPFFTTKETGKGTGLGLSICHGIVAEHGGQIYARSQPGKGTTMVVELPINGHWPYRGTS